MEISDDLVIGVGLGVDPRLLLGIAKWLIETRLVEKSQANQTLIVVVVEPVLEGPKIWFILKLHLMFLKILCPKY